MVVLVALIAPAAAQSRTALAARISDQAFALLDTVNVTHERGSPSPLLGPLGGFASDAQRLATALAAHDEATAAAALADLKTDEQSVDRNASADKAHFDPARWNALKQEVASLDIRPPADAPPPSAAPVASGGDLSIKILSTQVDADGMLHLKGLIKGRNIQAAGIYRGQEKLAPLKVTPDAHEQRITLDLSIERPRPGTVIRVFDAAGNSAQAAVPAQFAGDDSAPAAAAPGPRNPPGAVAPRNVQVSIQQFTIVNPTLREYELRGQIAGSDLARAGIYVDGRLARQVPVNTGPGFHVTNFITNFALRGSQASLRVYTRHGGFQETPLSLNSYASGPYDASPNPSGGYTMPYGGGYAPNPYPYPPPIGIQITGIQPIGPSLMGVSGVITGRNLTGAGIYQNGMLVQPLNVGGGLLGELNPGAYQQYQFYGRFNPAVGMAVVRAYDAAGEVAQQPIVTGGYNPYGYTAPAPVLPLGPGVTTRPLMGPGMSPR